MPILGQRVVPSVWIKSSASRLNITGANMDVFTTDSAHTWSMFCRFNEDFGGIGQTLLGHDPSGLGVRLFRTTAGALQAEYLQQTLSTRTATGGRLHQGRIHHVALVCVPSSRFDLYIDGGWVAGQTFTSTLRDGAGTTMWLGNSQNFPTHSLKGEMGYVGFWRRALGIPEVVALSHGFNPRDLKPDGAWLVDPANLLTDFGPNGYHATATGTPGKGRLLLPPRAIISDRLLKGGASVTIAAPTNTVPPTITGLPETGQTLSVSSTGTWTGSPTFTYQWQYNDGIWNNIAGATSSTWVVDISGAVDVGDSIRCVVTGTNGAGSADANSNSVAPVTTLSLSGHQAAVSLG